MNRKKSESITAEAFARLGKEKQLQEYSGIIFKLIGLVIDFISAEGETLRISRGVNFNPYCILLRGSKKGKEACLHCDVSNALRAADEKRPICYTCHAGLHEIVVPVFDDTGIYIGCMTSGQFHLSDSPLLRKKAILELADRYEVNGEKLFRAYKKSISLTPLQVEGILTYLGLIGKHLTGIRDHLIFMEKINTPDKIMAVKKYIDDNYASELSIEQTAQKFHISPDYLAHKFKDAMNVSFQRYVRFRRIAVSREMLSGTTLSVSEIAYSCGFGSVSQFNRMFRSAAGMAPGRYRELNRNA